MTLLSRASSLFSLLLRRPQLFVPDRRPIKGVGGFGGHYSTDQDFGRRPENLGYDRPETQRWILGELDAAVASGWRRILLDRLFGHPKEQRWVPMAQFFGGNDAPALFTILTKWIASNPGVDVYAYLGIKTSRKWVNQFEFTDEDSRVLNIDRRHDQIVLEECLEPWLQCGVRGFSFDAATEPDALGPFFEMRKWIRQRHPDLWVGGEAIPVEKVGMAEFPYFDWKIQQKHVASSPWQVSSTFMRDRDPVRLWTFDQRRAEVNVSLEDREVTEEEVVSWHGRGCNFIDFTGGKFDSIIMQLKRSEQ